MTEMINSIEISNKYYDEKSDDKINPTEDYNKIATIQLNTFYKEE